MIGMVSLLGGHGLFGVRANFARNRLCCAHAANPIYATAPCQNYGCLFHTPFAHDCESRRHPWRQKVTKKLTKWLQIYTTRDYREKITMVAARGTREPRNARRAAGGAFPEGFPECEEGGWGRPGAGGPWNASRGAEGALGAGSLGMQAEGLGAYRRWEAKPPKVHKQPNTTPGVAPACVAPA